MPSESVNKNGGYEMIEKNRTNGGRYLSESDRTAMQKEQREAKAFYKWKQKKKKEE